MNIGAILSCWGACLAMIPWWVWLVLPLAGAVIGAITYLVGLLTAGSPLTIVVNALIKAAVFGALAGVLSPIAFCLLKCLSK